MSRTPTAGEVLDREFLVIRGKLLEAAAALDRIDRGSGKTDDARLANLRKALGVMAGDAADRARQLQLIFSLDYDPAWRKK